MGLKILSHFRCILIKPCKKLLQLFKFKLHKPLSIRPLRSRPRRKPNTSSSTRQGPRRLSKILPVLCSLTRTKEMDRSTEFTSFSDPGQRIAPHPSPLTPSYVRLVTTESMGKVDASNQHAACRCFENHLMEMIVEEGKMRDLADVEEFVYCWKRLTCPVFMDLVSRFYGELCTDLFSGACENEIGDPKEYLL